MQKPAAAGDADHLSGTSIKGYELLERIGAGGFGAVYRAHQSTIHREVAIKIILPGWANNPEFIRRFETEAQVIARLEHPHIVPLYDYWRDASGAYLVMRYLRGGSVSDALRDGPLDLQSVSRLLDQVTSALDLAHRNQVIHRDIKPGNILLDEDGNAYLGDFGIAKDLAGPQDSSTAPDSVIGSLDYISPEQARSEPVSPQTDIYSLGVTLFEMIAGQHPFKDSSSVEKLFHHINDPLPLITDLDTEVCEAVNAVIQTATAKAPPRRYPDVLSLAVALRESIGRGDTAHELQVIEQLTLREHEVLQLIAEGKSNQEIGNQLFVTVATVRWHIRQLYKKLGVRSRVQAIIRARELDLIITEAASDTSFSDGATIISRPEPENPYKGLRPFQVADSPDFFGREVFVAKLLERLSDHHRFSRFLAIVGPSGSGKSSLVRAGLIPALWQGKLPGSERWFVVDLIPGTRPLDQLEVALTRVAANHASNLQEHLMRNANGLLRAADLILPRDNTELVLFVDQFEELFTLVEEESVRAHFLALLHAAVTDPRSRIRVIVTLRADYYDRPLHYPEFGELIRTRMETVLPLSAQGLEQAITGPAQRVGITFEPGLVAAMVSEVHYQAGALPLLQYALTELFERRTGRVLTQATYEQIGGAVGALAHRADEIFLDLDDQGRELTRQMFLRLVTLGDRSEDTRRRVPRSELLALDADSDLMEDIIDAFADYRLLSLDHEPDTRRPVVEVAHEAILREWGRLHAWLDESRHDIRQQRLLAAAAAEWAQAGKESSYLLRGARLEQMDVWARETTLALTQHERAYLDTSRTQQIREEESERARQAQELALAQQAAQSQRRAAQRLRALVVALTVFLAAAVGLSIFAFGKQRDAEHARATSAANAVIAMNNAAQAQELALVNGAQAALGQNNLELALALAVPANRFGNPSGQAQRTLSQAAYAPGPVRVFEGGAFGAMSVAYSADGTTILAGFGDGTASVWDASSGSLLHRLVGHTNFIFEVEIAPDKRTAFTLGADRNIILWDLTTGEEIRRFGSDLILGPDALSATFSPDGRTILSNNGAKPLSNPGEIALLILWDVATGQPIRTFKGHTRAVGAVAISPDGQRAISGDREGEMILWDLGSGAILRRFNEGTGNVRKIPSDLAFSPDGRRVYAKTIDGLLTAWDLETFAPLYDVGTALEGDLWQWSQVALSPDGRLLAADIVTGGLGVWDAATGAIFAELPAGTGAAFSPDSRRMFANGSSGMTLWEITSGAQLQRFDAALPVGGLALSPDGSILVAATATIMFSPSPQCEFVVFDVAAGQPLRRLKIGPDEMDLAGCTLWSSPAFSPDGRTIFTGVDERVIAWDANTGARLVTFSGHHASVTSIAPSPDGHTVLSGDSNGQLLLWDAATGQAIHRLSGHTLDVTGIIFAGETALSSSADGTVIAWDAITGQEIRRYAGVQSGAYSIQISPDRQSVLACDDSGQMLLWDYESGQLTRSIATPSGCKRAIFTPDGHHILTSGVLLWDLDTGEIIRQYPFAGDMVMNPDGSSFFADTGMFRAAVVYQFRIDALDQLVTWTLDHRYVREMNCDERALYQLEPGCDAALTFPTRTPYPTNVPTAEPISVRPASTTGAGTATPSITPPRRLIAQLGDNRGEISVGGEQIWLYEGRAGETLTIEVWADHPANWALNGGAAPDAPGVLDTLVIVTAPDGRDLNVYNTGGLMPSNRPRATTLKRA